jgi:DNA-binding MarR family transcriptional regulator
LAAFRCGLRQFLRFSESAAASAGVTPRRYQALLAIKGFPGRDSVTIGELSEQLQIAHHSAVRLVDRLEAQHLIIRVASNEDRRQVYVTPPCRALNYSTNWLMHTRTNFDGSAPDSILLF